MNSQEYVKNAIRTESVPEKLVIDQIALHALMTMMVGAGNAVNHVKRKLYYGKPVPNEDFVKELASTVKMGTHLYHLSCFDMINNPRSAEDLAKVDTEEMFKSLDTGKINIRLLHAAMGMFTESVEMIEALLHQYEMGVLDGVNFCEEIGDNQWYAAIACSELKANLGDIHQTNIAKLKARFPNKFDAGKALNRDLDTERAVLEGAQQCV